MGANPIGNLGRSALPDSAARIDDIADHVTSPAPAGTAFAGVKPIASPSDHVHPATPFPAVPPAVVASTLYPAKVDDPNLRPSLCLYHLWFNGEAPGWNSSQWTQISGVSTYQHNTNGVITGWLTDGDQVELNAGNLVFIRCDNKYPIAGVGDPNIASTLGIYEVFDPGSASTPAIIRRAPGENLPGDIYHGMVVKVLVGQFSDYPEFFTLTTSDPITIDTTPLTWTVSSSYTSADSYKLLTGPQLAAEGASTDVLETSVTRVNGVAGFPESFETLVGTPALSSLPAGIWTFDNELVWLDPAFTPSPGSTTTLRWRILDDNGSSDPDLFIAESPPITTTIPLPLSFQYNDSGHPISQPDRLVGIPQINTTSTTPVKLWLRYSSPARLTRITVPFALPISGASDGVHNHTTGRDKDVGSSDPTKTDPCHPACALGDGLMQTGFQTATSAGGCIPAPDTTKGNTILVTAAADSYYVIQWIGTTGLKSGTKLTLIFMNPCKVEPYNAETGLTQPANCAPLVLETNPGGSQDEIDWLTAPVSLGRLGVQYFATELPQSPCFLLTEGALI